MSYLDFRCLPTVIGSMPHTDPAEACSVVKRYLRDIPAWPQLPRRSFLEDMCAQVSAGFPGAVITGDSATTGTCVRVNRSGIEQPLAELYAAYLENDFKRYPISAEYAAGLHQFMSFAGLSPPAVKGQLAGPVTWGLAIMGEDNKAIIYDDVLGDAVPRFLRLKAAWQEHELRKLSKNTIIFVDEPYMSTFGSAGMLLSRERVTGLLEEVFAGISGTKGIHCCGNTDWSILLATTVDIISFDAYNLSGSLGLYPSEVKRFLDRKGTIAWGIVPNTAEGLERETPASLKDRLEEAMAPFARKGVPFRQLLEQAMLTPSCGLAGLSEEAAVRVLELLTSLSAKIRQRL